MKNPLVIIGVTLLSCGLLSAGQICAVPDTLELACIYSNFGEGQSFQFNSGLTPGFAAVGVSFTPSASFLLMNIEVAAYRANGEIPDSVQFSIHDSSGGFPGVSLETFSLSGLGLAEGLPAQGTIAAASVLHPLLTAGMQYWIVMSGVSPGDVTWNSNSVGRLGAATLLPSQEDGPYWSPLSDYSQGAFALDGDPSVPEPSTFWLVAPLAGSLLYVRRRRRARI